MKAWWYLPVVGVAGVLDGVAAEEELGAGHPDVGLVQRGRRAARASVGAWPRMSSLRRTRRSPRGVQDAEVHLAAVVEGLVEGDQRSAGRRRSRAARRARRPGWARRRRRRPRGSRGRCGPSSERTASTTKTAAQPQTRSALPIVGMTMLTAAAGSQPPLDDGSARGTGPCVDLGGDAQPVDVVLDRACGRRWWRRAWRPRRRRPSPGRPASGRGPRGCARPGGPPRRPAGRGRGPASRRTPRGSHRPRGRPRCGCTERWAVYIWPRSRSGDQSGLRNVVVVAAGVVDLVLVGVEVVDVVV